MINKLVLVSRIDFDKWFHLPFVMALKSERIRKLGVEIHLIGPSSPLTERILNMELRFTETQDFVVRHNKSIPMAEIFKQYSESSLFVADSVYDYLGYYCADVITAGCMLTCYNIGFREIPASLMFANTLAQLEDNIYRVIANESDSKKLKHLNELMAKEYSLNDADKALLDSIIL